MVTCCTTLLLVPFLAAAAVPSLLLVVVATLCVASPRAKLADSGSYDPFSNYNVDPSASPIVRVMMTLHIQNRPGAALTRTKSKNFTYFLMTTLAVYFIAKYLKIFG